MLTPTKHPSPPEGVAALEHEARSLLTTLDAHPAARRLFEGRIHAAGYAHYLVQTYHYVRWTTPLLAEAGHRLKQQGRHPLLAALLLQKANEERGHEKWLLADLKHLGWSAAQVEGVAPNPAVRAYVAWNRYTTCAGMPMAFLGTAYVLEYLSVQRAQATVARLLAANTIPNIHRAVTFLRGHGDADGDHVAGLTSLLSTLTAQDEQAALLLSARTTRALYPDLFPEEATPSLPYTS